MGKDVKVQTGKNEPKDWLNEYFYFDAEGRKARKENKTNEKWKASEHSLEENLKKYKECQEKVYQAYLEHLKVLTHNAEDPIKYIKDGINYLQESLTNENPPSGIMDIAAFSSFFDDLENIFNPEKIGYLHSKKTAISESLFDFKISPLIYPEELEKRLNDKVENGLVSKEHAENYLKVFKALSTDAPNLGIDKDTLDIMSSIAPLISCVEDRLSRIEEGVEVKIEVPMNITTEEEYTKALNQLKHDKNPFNDKENPYYGVLSEGRKISEKIRNYISGKSTDYPTEKDFVDYYNKLEAKVKDASLIKENGEVDRAIYHCFMACEEPVMFVPSLKERFELLNADFQKKILDEYKKNEDIVLNGDSNNPAFHEDICYNLSCLPETPKELFPRHNLIRIFESKAYRDIELKLAQQKLEDLTKSEFYYDAKMGWTLPVGQLRFKRHPVPDDYIHEYEDLCKTILACKMADYEQMRYTRYMDVKQAAEANGNVYDLVGLGYNKELYPIFDGSARIEGEFANYLDDYFKKLWDLNDFRTCLDFENFKYGIGQPTNLFRENEVKYGDKTYKEIRIDDKNRFLGHVRMMNNLSLEAPEIYGLHTLDHKDMFLHGDKMKSILRPLTQLKGNKNKNSKEYNELTQALTDIGMKSASIDGVSSADYANIFNKADRYLKTHETRLSGPNGQARVTASFKLFYEVGNKLALDVPGKKDEILLKMKVQMLRDTEFRKYAVQQAGLTIQKTMSTSELNAMTYMNLSKADKNKIDIALETLSFCRKAEGLLMGTKYADSIKGKFPTQEDKVQKVLEKYEDAFEYTEEDFLTAIKDAGQYAIFAKEVAEDTWDDVAEMETRAELLSVQRAELSDIIKASLVKNDDNTVLEAFTHLVYMSTVEMQKDIVNANVFNQMLDPQVKAENVEKLKPMTAKILSNMSDNDFKALGETDFNDKDISKALFTRLKLESKNVGYVKNEYNANLQKNGGVFKRKDPEIDQPQLNMM